MQRFCMYPSDDKMCQEEIKRKLVVFVELISRMPLNNCWCTAGGKLIKVEKVGIPNDRHDMT